MFMNGFTYGYDATKGNYRTENAMISQDKLVETGINWVCIANDISQETYYSTEILSDYKKSVTDKDLSFAIQRFHEKGVKVCLKPTLNCLDGVWRALIDFPDKTMSGEDIYWSKWFASYTSFMCHYAEIAQDEGCEMLCIGSELVGTERKEKYWRSLIEQVRQIYDGPLIYSTNHGKEDRVRWFDALDYIGSSAYYPVAKYPGDSKENMMEEWSKVGEKLKALSERLHKKVIFMEIGCRSARGCAKFPWDTAHQGFPVDEDEQANFYDSCLSALKGQDWFEGVFWREWSTEIYTSRKAAQADTSFNIYRKKAEQVLKKWYQQETND